MSTLTKTVRSLATAVLATGLAALAGTTPAAAAADPDPFSGERRIVLAPEGHEFALTITRDGTVSSTERWGRRAQLVATPLGGDRFWLQTAHLRRGGEALCLQLRSRTVVTAACDAGAKHQRFRFTDAGDDASGNPTYTIRTGSHRHLVVTDDGAFAATRITEGTPDVDTPFLLVDRGRASLPALD